MNPKDSDQNCHLNSQKETCDWSNTNELTEHWLMRVSKTCKNWVFQHGSPLIQNLTLLLCVPHQNSSNCLKYGKGVFHGTWQACQNIYKQAFFFVWSLFCSNGLFLLGGFLGWIFTFHGFFRNMFIFFVFKILSKRLKQYIRGSYGK